MLTDIQKQSAVSRCYCLRDADGRRKRQIDAVSSVLYRDGAASPATGNHRDGLAAVTPQGKQEGNQLFVLRFNPRNGVLLAFFRFCQIHAQSPDSEFCPWLGAANRRVKI